ncbi:nucleoside kinase [Maritalea sp.]|uniref:nucleoside kinase n=1 Tax=Maritalea sp. TaxID=2003361 RepID=UPI003EF94F40
MGSKNYLIRGVSCTGKTTVHHELVRRGFHSFNGDKDLAYQGDPKTGIPMPGSGHDHHIWSVEKVRSIMADDQHRASFFCGDCRNFSKFIQFFDKVFVLNIDRATLDQRLAKRPANEWGGKEHERQLIRRIHAEQEDFPKKYIMIDATASLTDVVMSILDERDLTYSR